jgi:hypothetical protein
LRSRTGGWLRAWQHCSSADQHVVDDRSRIRKATCDARRLKTFGKQDRGLQTCRHRSSKEATDQLMTDGENGLVDAGRWCVVQRIAGHGD